MYIYIYMYNTETGGIECSLLLTMPLEPNPCARKMQKTGRY